MLFDADVLPDPNLPPSVPASQGPESDLRVAMCECVCARFLVCVSGFLLRSATPPPPERWLGGWVDPAGAPPLFGPFGSDRRSDFF